MTSAGLAAGLLRTITEEEVARYAEHGVVHLPGLFDSDWVAEAERVFEIVLCQKVADVNEVNATKLAGVLRSMGVPLIESDDQLAQAEGQFKIRSANSWKIPALADLGTSPPLAELAARLMGAHRINYYLDQLFLKEPKSIHRTAFHQDAPYFHLEADQCCTLWMPLDEVELANSAMGYVRGSHRWQIHAPNAFVTQTPVPGAPQEPLPDIEGNEADFDIGYVECSPGDAIVHHVRTIHGSTGNVTDRSRRAITFRFLGDDARYIERTGTPDDSPKSDSLSPGDMMDSPEFPLIWTHAEGYLADWGTG